MRWTRSSKGATVNPHTYVGQQRCYRMPTADLCTTLGFSDYAQGGRVAAVAAGGEEM